VLPGPEYLFGYSAYRAPCAAVAPQASPSNTYSRSARMEVHCTATFAYTNDCLTCACLTEYAADTGI